MKRLTRIFLLFYLTLQLSCMKGVNPLDPENTVYFVKIPEISTSYAASFEIRFEANSDSIIHYIAVPAGSAFPLPIDVYSGKGSNGTNPLVASSYRLSGQDRIAGAVLPQAGVSYDVYFVAETVTGLKNILTTVYKVTGTTSTNYYFSGSWTTNQYGIVPFNVPKAILEDPEGNVYVTSSGDNRILKYDHSGYMIDGYGIAVGGSSNGQFQSPYGLCRDREGNFYVADEGNHRVQKFDANWNFILKWGSTGSGPGNFNNPVGVCADPSGYIYVADYANREVQKFDANGNFIRIWGSFGSGDGQFINPRGICSDRAGFVYVADEGNNRIQKFDSEGNFLLKWGVYGLNDGEFNGPQSVCADQAGIIYVLDLSGRIQKFDSSGNFIMSWGSVGGGDGKSITVGRFGNVYIADTHNDRIMNFR